MMKYRGYYIDHVIFHSKADIDAFVKKNAVNAYRRACRMFAESPSMECSIYCHEQAQRLHDDFGLSFSEIEEIEISAYAA